MAAAEIHVRFGALPPFSPVLVRLLDVLGQGEADLRRVSALLSEEPALAAQVLRTANSALFCRRGRVSSLLMALSMIGTDKLYALVLTTGLKRLTAPVARYPVAHRAWRHSVATALLAADLGMEDFGDATEDYTAGLLHDLGRLVFLATAPQEYSTLVEEAACGDSRALERELFGMTHEEAGAAAMRQYGFPDRLVGAAAMHHCEDLLQLSRQAPDAALVASCCRTASLCGYAVVQPPVRAQQEAEEEDPGALADDDLCLYLKERMDEIEASFGLRL